MAKKNKNPYSEKSAYNGIFAAIRKAGTVTRNALIDLGFTVHDVTVVLSPRAEGTSKRTSDCRGNFSAQGHVYFMDKLNKKKGEAQRFRLRWRKTPMDKRVRPITKTVKAKVKKAPKAKTVTKKATATVEA